MKCYLSMKFKEYKDWKVSQSNHATSTSFQKKYK